MKNTGTTRFFVLIVEAGRDDLRRKLTPFLGEPLLPHHDLCAAAPAQMVPERNGGGGGGRPRGLAAAGRGGTLLFFLIPSA